MASQAEASGFYGLIAKAKTQGGSDGEFIKAKTQGSIVLEKLILKTTGLKKTVILVGHILEANATEAGVTPQLPGCKVKQLYMLTKYDWAIDALKTDLVNIIGIDEKGMEPEQVEEMMACAFEGVANEKGERPGVSAFKGCVANFRGYVVTDRGPGKPDLSKVVFSHAEGDINSSENIEKRAAAIQ